MGQQPSSPEMEMKQTCAGSQQPVRPLLHTAETIVDGQLLWRFVRPLPGNCIAVATWPWRFAGLCRSESPRARTGNDRRGVCSSPATNWRKRRAVALRTSIVSVCVRVGGERMYYTMQCRWWDGMAGWLAGCREEES